MLSLVLSLILLFSLAPAMNNDDDGDDDDKDNNVGVLAWRAVKNVCLFFWLSTVACLSV